MFSFIFKITLVCILTSYFWPWIFVLTCAFNILFTLLLFICLYAVSCTKSIFSEAFKKIMKLTFVTFFSPSWKMYYFRPVYYFTYEILVILQQISFQPQEGEIWSYLFQARETILTGRRWNELSSVGRA